MGDSQWGRNLKISSLANANLVAAFLEGTASKAETRKLIMAVGASATLFATVAAAAAVTSCASYLIKKAADKESKKIRENLNLEIDKI